MSFNLVFYPLEIYLLLIQIFLRVSAKECKKSVEEDKDKS